MRRLTRLAPSVAALTVAGLGLGLATASADTPTIVQVAAIAAATGITHGATASAPATPGTSVQLTPLPSDPACRPPASVPAGAKQVVRVDASGTSATVDLLQLVDGTWQCTRQGMTGRVGKNGVRPLAQRVSGDGTTPAGTFPLGTMTAPDGHTFQFFGNGVNPGVHGSWRQVMAGDCWDASGGDPTYNTLTSRVCGGVQRRRRVPADLRRGLLACGPDRGEHGAGPLRRSAGRDATGGGDLPPPLQLRRRRQQQADLRLRVAGR